MLTRTDGKSLLYPGLVHSIHGESESGKSWVSQYAVAHCLRLDQDVLVIDNESDAASYVQRLILLRVTREQIRTHLSYVRPESSPNTSAVELAAFERMLGQPYRLTIIDGVTDSMSLFGLSIKDNDEVARWMRSLPRRIADQTGAAVVLIDHVVKSSDNQGRFAIGAQSKMAGLTGAAYVVEVVEALGVGRKGELALRVGKDRPGAVRGRGTGPVPLIGRGNREPVELPVPGTGREPLEPVGVEEVMRPRRRGRFRTVAGLGTRRLGPSWSHRDDWHASATPPPLPALHDSLPGPGAFRTRDAVVTMPANPVDDTELVGGVTIRHRFGRLFCVRTPQAVHTSDRRLDLGSDSPPTLSTSR